MFFDLRRKITVKNRDILWRDLRCSYDPPKIIPKALINNALQGLLSFNYIFLYALLKLINFARIFFTNVIIVTLLIKRPNYISNYDP